MRADGGTVSVAVMKESYPELEADFARLVEP